MASSRASCIVLSWSSMKFCLATLLIICSGQGTASRSLSSTAADPSLPSCNAKDLTCHCGTDLFDYYCEAVLSKPDLTPSVIGTDLNNLVDRYAPQLGHLKNNQRYTLDNLLTALFTGPVQSKTAFPTATQLGCCNQIIQLQCVNPSIKSAAQAGCSANHTSWVIGYAEDKSSYRYPANAGPHF